MRIKVRRDLLSRQCLFRAAIATILCGTWARLQAAAGEDKRVAITGYDPVAYFTDGHPVKGSSAFSSAEHQKIFAADPDRYAPHYSGYCANRAAAPPLGM
jgi:hypothetical protein